jgi:serine/threonine protein kinase
MDSRISPTFVDKIRDIYVKEDGDSKIFDQEIGSVSDALNAIAEQLGDAFEFDKPLGRGGAGIVVKIKDARLDANRALKLPRPKDDQLIESVRNEIAHLKALRHPHLIRLHALGDVAIKKYPHYPYFLMDFIDNPLTLRSATQERLARAHSRDLAMITEWLATSLCMIADALAFLHSHQTIHFDVKPGNILVDDSGKPLLTDLGFAKRRTDSDVKTVAGFTLFYAHPDLSREYQQMSSQNRVRKALAPKFFKCEWDIYAFGKTVLEILAQIDEHFPDAVSYDYTFGYLHLMACRMLDGWNMSKDDVKRVLEETAGRPRSTYWETWQNLKKEDLKELSYATVTAVAIDLRKLTTEEPPITVVPELGMAPTSPQY